MSGAVRVAAPVEPAAEAAPAIAAVWLFVGGACFSRDDGPPANAGGSDRACDTGADEYDGAETVRLEVPAGPLPVRTEASSVSSRSRSWPKLSRLRISI